MRRRTPMVNRVALGDVGHREARVEQDLNLLSLYRARDERRRRAERIRRWNDRRNQVKPLPRTGKTTNPVAVVV